MLNTLYSLLQLHRSPRLVIDLGCIPAMSGKGSEIVALVKELEVAIKLNNSSEDFSGHLVQTIKRILLEVFKARGKLTEEEASSVKSLLLNDEVLSNFELGLSYTFSQRDYDKQNDFKAYRSGLRYIADSDYLCKGGNTRKLKSLEEFECVEELDEVIQEWNDPPYFWYPDTNNMPEDMPKSHWWWTASAPEQVLSQNCSSDGAKHSVISRQSLWEEKGTDEGFHSLPRSPINWGPRYSPHGNF